MVAVVVVGVGLAGKKTKLEMLIAILMVPKGKGVKLNKINFLLVYNNKYVQKNMRSIHTPRRLTRLGSFSAAFGPSPHKAGGGQHGEETDLHLAAKGSKHKVTMQFFQSLIKVNKRFVSDPCGNSFAKIRAPVLAPVRAQSGA